MVGERHLEESFGERSSLPVREEGASLAVMLQRLLVCIDRPSAISGPQEVFDRLLGVVRLAEVARQEGEGLLGDSS